MICDNVIIEIDWRHLDASADLQSWSKTKSFVLHLH